MGQASYIFLKDERLLNHFSEIFRVDCKKNYKQVSYKKTRPFWKKSFIACLGPQPPPKVLPAEMENERTDYESDSDCEFWI